MSKIGRQEDCWVVYHLPKRISENFGWNINGKIILVFNWIISKINVLKGSPNSQQENPNGKCAYYLVCSTSPVAVSRVKIGKLGVVLQLVHANLEQTEFSIWDFRFPFGQIVDQRVVLICTTASWSSCPF